MCLDYQEFGFTICSQIVCVHTVSSMHTKTASLFMFNGACTQFQIIPCTYSCTYVIASKFKEIASMSRDINIVLFQK